MNPARKSKTILILLLSLSIIAPKFPFHSTPLISEAATIKISQTKLTLVIGNSSTLKISGTSQKPAWSSNKKNIATVSSTGKVTAKSSGKAKITASVNGKKYTCTVTVTPYKVKKATINNVSFSIPITYTSESITDTKDSIYYYPYTSNPDTNSTGVVVSISKTDTPAISYSKLKKAYSELIKSEFTSAGIKISNYTVTNYPSASGKALVASFTTTIDYVTVKQTYYILSINKYLVQVVATKQKNTANSPKVATVAKYILNSLELKK